jgi:uroporphyrinogen-III synthase
VTETLPTILLTRPAAQSEEAARRLRARLGREIPILVSPILDIVPVPFALTFVPRFVILTSAHAAVFAGRAGLAGLPAWCVGDRTAEAAAEAGLLPRSAAGDAGALLALLMSARPEGPGVYLRGNHAASDIAKDLISAGIDTHSVIAYDQLPRPLSPEARAALDGTSPVLLPVYSPRSARLLAAEIRSAKAPLHLITISANAAAAWKESAASVSIAATPDGPAMEDAVVAEARARSAC